ncbi:MAG: FIST N-terminal domain-containing protein [Burkholderiales bacterium]
MTMPPSPLFLHGHATHPDLHMAVALAAAQIEAQRDTQRTAQRRAHPGATLRPLSLGWVYFSDRYGAAADALWDELRQRWPGVAWVGAAGVGIAASGVEYLDEPAVVLMLCDLDPASFRVFNGARPLPAAGTLVGDEAWTALVHADGRAPDLPELLRELAGRTGSGYLFGGLVSARGRAVQLAEGVFDGGCSGVAFGRGVPLLSRVTQGCQPVAPVHRITAAQGNLVLRLDGQPALPVLLADLGITPDDVRAALPRLRATLAGLSDAGADVLAHRGQFGTDVRVRHLIGLDPGRQGFALADQVEPGMQLAFCRRDAQAARRDLVRICSEIREEVAAWGEATTAADTLASPATHAASPASPAWTLAGALYISCAGRGGPHFGGPSAELELVRHALGDVPLVGLFAGGEIARHHLYGYTGVLTVFLAPVAE